MPQSSEVRGRSTAIYVDEKGYTNIIYHNTAVVKFNEKEIILNTGGYRTYTTKLRMNQAANQFRLGFTVTQKNYEWFIEHYGKTFPWSEGQMVLNREVIYA